MMHIHKNINVFRYNIIAFAIVIAILLFPKSSKGMGDNTENQKHPYSVDNGELLYGLRHDAILRVASPSEARLIRRKYVNKKRKSKRKSKDIADKNRDPATQALPDDPRELNPNISYFSFKSQIESSLPYIKRKEKKKEPKDKDSCCGILKHAAEKKGLIESPKMASNVPNNLRANQGLDSFKQNRDDCCRIQ
jgi:hypothetical protein